MALDLIDTYFISISHFFILRENTLSLIFLSDFLILEFLELFEVDDGAYLLFLPTLGREGG